MPRLMPPNGGVLFPQSGGLRRRSNFHSEIEPLSNLLRGGGTLDIVKTLVREA